MAGSLQGPAAASLDRTPYGGGKSGGKINRPRQHINSHQDHRPLASSSTTLARKGPYDRPPNGPHSSRGLASRILTGASTFLSSFFRKEPAPSTPLGINDVELVATQVPEEPGFEDLLKERAFSRDQCDRLIKVLQSKMKDNGPLPLPQANGPLSNGLVEDRFPDEELEREQEAREREPERRARETIMDTTDPDSSPVDIARAYMGNRISPVPGAYPVKTLDYGVGRSRDYGVGRSRDDLPRVATPGHTPYVKLRHSRIYDRPTPVTLRTSTVRERKRRVDEDADHNVHRTRMKLSNGPPVSSLPSGSSDYGNGSYLDRMRRLQKKRVERKSEEDVTDLVPMQSTETARRILATLETLTPPKLKTLEEELTLMREKRPTELSPSMLNEQARNTMLAIECPVPEKSIEAFNRPSSTEAPATRVPQPSTDDLKGKGVTPAAEAGPSVVKVPSPSKEKNLRGFRMNTSFEEFNSDDEALPSSSPFTVPQEFTGFASESTTSTVLAPPAPPTAVDHTPVSLPAAVEDNSSKDGKQPETTNIVPESDTKPQPHPVFQFPTSTSATVPLVPVPSSSSAISFQPSPAFSNSFAVPLTAPPVSVSVPAQTPATSIFQSSSGLTSNGIFGGVTTSAPSTNIDVPVADAEKSVVKDAVDNKVSSESAVDNKDSNLSEPVPPVSVTEEATKPAFTFVSTGPAFATSTSTVSLAGSDAKPVAGGPSSTGGDAGASGAINPLAGIPPFSSSSSLFSTSSSSLPFSSSSSASTVFAFTTPSSSPFTFGAVTTSSASTPNAGSAIFGNPFSSSAGGSSSSPASGGDMDMADEPAQTSTPASPLFASSQPFVFSSPSPAPAPATPAPSPFGTQQTPVFAFGTPPATTSTSPFPAPSVFGIGSSSSFGGTSAPAFGTSTSFGGSSTPAFGTSAPAFGAGSSVPAFGAGSSVPAFGAGSSAPAFGAGSSAPAFGAGSSAPAFGAPTGFGGSSAPAFGASTGFGGASAPAAFGASPGFGGTSAPAFGTSTSFGVASAPSFGAAPVFSSMPSAPAFGGGPSAPAFGAQPFGVQPAVGSQPAGSFGQFQVGQFQIGEKTEKERRTFRYKRTGTTRRPK